MGFNIFEPDTGLKEDYDGTIVDASFVQGDNLGWSLQLTILADDGDEITPKFSLGAKSGFTSYDGGETVQGPSPTTKLKESTSFYKFMNQCAKAGAAEDMKNRSDTLYDERGPLHAKFWVGFRFHFDVIMDKTARRPNDETGQWDLVRDATGAVVGAPISIPTRYLGIGSVDNGHQSSLMDNADLETITHLASITDDFTSFAQAVLDMKDSHGQPMAKNKTIMGKLNQKWYEELRGGVSV